MKRINFISLITAAFAFGFASCSDNGDEFVKGEADLAGCYGVYFPAQNTTLSLDPSEPTTATILVARTKSEGAITVPFELKDDNNVFAASELKFEDGQTESSIELSFPKAEIGVTYTCSFAIKDKLYASQYTSNAIALDFSIMRDKWNSLGNASFVDYFFFTESVECELLQNDLDKSKYRLMNPYDEIIEAGVYEGAETTPSEYISFKTLKAGEKPLDNAVAITSSNLVYFSTINTGYHHPSYGQDVLAIHPANFSSLAGDESNFQFSKVIQYQENGLPAGVQLAPYYYMNGVGGWSYFDADPSAEDQGGMLIVFPGAVLTDYSLKVEAGFSEEGVIPVTFTFGADVAYAKYAAYEGALNSAQMEAKFKAIISGEEPSTNRIDSTSVVGLSFEKTGVYSILAVAYSEDNTAQSNASLLAKYVAEGDEMPVSAYAELISTKKYERDTLSSDNILEFSLFGSGLTDAYLGIFTSRDFADYADECVAFVLDPESECQIDEEDLAVINDSVLTGVITDLNPGTEYTLVFVASNGYEQSTVTAVATTTGEPKPIYMNYSAGDINFDILPETAAGYDGTYDLYASILGYEDASRMKVSSVTFEANSDSTIVAKGIFAPWADASGFNDSITFECWDGLLYTVPSYMEATEDGYYAAVLYFSTTGKTYGHTNLYAMFGGLVEEGHIAFCDNYTGVDICGWRLGAYGDDTYAKSQLLRYLGGIYNILFTPSGMYDEESSQAPAMTQNIAGLSNFVNNKKMNYVETPDGFVKSAIREYKNMSRVSARGIRSNVAVETEGRSAVMSVVNVESKKADRSFIEIVERVF